MAPPVPLGSARTRRLSDPASFAALATSRTRARSGPVTVAWVPGNVHEPARVGYAIGKKVGGAVVRNRLRRRLRALMGRLAAPSGAYLIWVRPEAVALTTRDLEGHLTKALRSLPPNERAAK